jgi:Major capsid protein Gp23
MANVLERLTEGVVERNMLKETEAVVSKWEKSGLLEGLKSARQKSTMAVLLENQAKELLKESTTMAGGDVQGFAAVAFPIVRRVFAGLIANDLVSVQPMSLPSGLVFFMDFRRGTTIGNDQDKAFAVSSSFFGDRLGVEITGGVRVDGIDYAEKGFYNLANGYGTSRYSSAVSASNVNVVTASTIAGLTDAGKKLVRFDADLLNDTTYTDVAVVEIPLTAISQYGLLAVQDVFATTFVEASGSFTAVAGEVPAASVSTTSFKPIRRLSQIVDGTTGTASGVKALKLVLVATSGITNAGGKLTEAQQYGITVPIKDNLTTVGDSALGALVGATPWTFEGSAAIPEIELKVDSFSITARTRKLKAAWTPELGQDLNAYHNLDAEVELTSMLSEQIGLEIDQEIMNDLVKGQTAGVKYWSRRPGKFVNRDSGLEITGTYSPDFTGNVSMWYETLVETINDVSALIHRKTLRGGANFLVCGPEVANILEFTSGFRASVTADAEKGTVGAVKVGDLNKKWDVIVHPYFHRNVILVGRKGSSFLESGYVYAPYVPLQSTPTIFDPNTFVPRKAVMTRYGKAMVRPDMYGLVVVQDILG